MFNLYTIVHLAPRSMQGYPLFGLNGASISVVECGGSSREVVSIKVLYSYLS